MSRCVSWPKLFHSKVEMMPVFSSVKIFEQFNIIKTIQINLIMPTHTNQGVNQLWSVS